MIYEWPIPEALVHLNNFDSAMSMELGSLQQKLHHDIGFDFKVVKVLCMDLKIVQFEKGEHLNNKINFENQIPFLQKGLLKEYANVDGSERIKRFYLSDQFISTVSDKYLNDFSEFHIEALLQSRVVMMTLKNLKPDAFENVKNAITLHLLREELHALEFQYGIGLMSTPKQRLLYFNEKMPELINIISRKNIAYFLNMRPETLSRLRRGKS